MFAKNDVRSDAYGDVRHDVRYDVRSDVNNDIRTERTYRQLGLLVRFGYRTNTCIETCLIGKQKKRVRMTAWRLHMVSVVGFRQTTTC